MCLVIVIFRLKCKKILPGDLHNMDYMMHQGDKLPLHLYNMLSALWSLVSEIDENTNDILLHKPYDIIKTQAYSFNVSKEYHFKEKKLLSINIK